MIGGERMANKICGVYKIKNIVNDKFYIGSSKDIKNRWKQHKDQLRANKHGNAYLQNAWNKYGEKNFTFEVIEECEPSIQFEREQYYLNELNPFDNRGYNIVRQISKEYMSDHYMVKKCEKCGGNYNTFSHLSKYCDECKEKMKVESAENWKLEKQEWIEFKRDQCIFDELMCSIYGSMEYFWESALD